jgi:type I restriction enzyme S subunit
MVCLGELLEPVRRPERVVAGKTYRLLGAHWYAEGLYIKDTCDGAAIRGEKLFRVEQGDFVYNRLFAWKGSFAIAGVDVAGCYVSNEFPCFRVRTERLNSQYLWRYMSREPAWAEALGLSSGSTPTSRNRLKEEKLLGMAIPLPAIAEQRRIVARIEELAAKIADARRLRQEAAEELRILQESIKRSVFPPAGHGTVGDYATVQSGYAFKSEWFTEDGIRLVRNVNIGHGQIEWGQVARIPRERRGEFARFELHENDILITLDRPIISTGVKVARVGREDLPSLLLQRVGRLQFRDRGVLPEYLFAWLQSSHFVESIDPGRSNGVPHISPKDVERASFVAPPLAEQRRIVAYLDGLSAKAEALKQLQAATAGELDALLPSVLDRAFKGEM